MEKKKRQHLKEGAIVKIELEKINKTGFGRLFNGLVLGVYNYLIRPDDKLPTVSELSNQKIIFFVAIHKRVITSGDFPIIDYKPLQQVDIESVPPQFTQDKVNLEDCVIFYTEDRVPQRRATPEECIGLEISSVWDSVHVIKRMEDFYLNKRNYTAEMGKVILSKDDPRYLAPPGALRWDFEKGEFYRTDK